MPQVVRLSFPSRRAALGINSTIRGLRPWLLVFVLFLMACAVGFAQGPPAPLRRIRLDMVFSTSLFRAANRNDAIAAVRVWAGMFSRAHGFQVDPTVEAVDDVAELRNRVLAGSANVLALDVVEYFEMADLNEVEPVFCALRGERNVPPRYLILVGADSGISSLEGLRGKSAIIHANTGANMGQIWLDAMLYDRHLGRSEHFLRSAEVVAKASSAILPTFFGKADAAVVDEGSFEVAREMNPQLGKKLRVPCTSPPLPEGLLCICRNRIDFQDEFRADVQELQSDAQGKQILMVFRFSRLAPLDKSALDEARELWRKHNLLARLPGIAPGARPPGKATFPSGGGEEP